MLLSDADFKKYDTPVVLNKDAPALTGDATVDQWEADYWREANGDTKL